MSNSRNDIADAINELAEAVYCVDKTMDTRSDFNGFTIADSMGMIADALMRIAEAMEQKK